MLNLDTYNTIIFDLDGTLVDSVPDLTLALNHALVTLGYDEVQQTDVRAWVGNGSLKLIERALAELNKSDAKNVARLHKQFLKSYEQFLCQESELYPGVLELLRELHKQTKTLVLLTNKPIQFVPDLLSNLGIGHLFSLILGGDSLAEKKPHPLPLLHVLETLSVNPEQCLMVGDSRSDIVCAQQAGVHSVALLQGYHQGIDLAALEPTYVFDDVSALSEGLS
jgi:phosphoglycolate phosphatase